MNIDEMTIGQFKELSKLFKSNEIEENKGLCSQVGSYVVIRTFSAGCWFGKLVEKNKNEIYLSEARRLWKWSAKKGISLSGVAEFGVNVGESKIEAPLSNYIWLEAIEILPATEESRASICCRPPAVDQ